MHRKIRSRRTAALIACALAVLAGAFSLLATPVADQSPAVAGTYLCVVQANGDGFNQNCDPVPVSPSGTPTVPPPTPTASPTPTGTPTVEPTTPTPSPTTPSPTPTTPSPTVTPTPSPTSPSPSPTSSSWPDSSNTGPTGTLTPMACPSGGAVIIRTAGTVLQNVDLDSCGIDIQASNVVIRNVKAKSSWADGYLLIVRNGGSAVVQDVELSGVSTGQPVQYAILAQANATVTIQRVEMYWCTDCVQGEHVTMTDSYIHAMTNPSGAHPDGFQCNVTCTGTVLRHNRIENLTGNNYSVALFCDWGRPNGVVIDNNYIDNGGDGSYTIYACGGNHAITNNVVGLGTWGWLNIPSGSGSGNVISGNKTLGGKPVS